MAGRPKGVKNKRSQHKWSEEENNVLKDILYGFFKKRNRTSSQSIQF